MSETTKPNKKRLRWWLLALLLIFVGVGLGGWLYAKNVVAQRIETQLAELGFGTPNIGKVSIGASGVEARGVTFSNPANELEPLVKLDSLSIRHPFVGLASGDDVFNGLELKGLRAVVNVEDLKGNSSFDLSAIQLPARTLSIEDSTIVLRQNDRADFSISKIDAKIESLDNGLAIQGVVGELLGGQWRISGQSPKENNAWNIELTTNSVKIEDGQWQKWPMLPSSIERYLKADVSASGRIELNGDSVNPLDYLAEINLQETDLLLPAFELPIKISTGQLTARDGKLSFQNVVASSDEKNQITGSGSTTITSFPLTTEFDAEFKDLSVETIRKLASPIPTSVAGRASGNVKGTIDVEQSLRTTLSLSGTGHSDNVTYGSITASSSTTQVELQPLIISDRLEVESLEGSVVVKAKASDLSANQVFKSLELPELGRQLEIEAIVSGDLRLEIPLATAEQIETWQMHVFAKAPKAKFSEQPLTNVVLSANLADGNLRFTQLDAAIGPDPNSKLSVTIDWPISSGAQHPDSGRFDVRGQQVPPGWIIGLLNQQIKNASLGKIEDASQSTIATSLDGLAGAVTFVSKFELPSAEPDAIVKWKVDGVVTGSSVVTQGHSLQNLSSILKLEDGLLSFSETKGSFENGGSLTADAKLDITESVLKSGSLRTREMPLSWLAKVGSELDASFKDSLASYGLMDGDQPEVGGNISIDFDLRDAVQLNDASWSIATRITSDRLIIKNQQLNQVFIDGNFDTNQINISKANADIEAGGKFDLTGHWQVAEQSGEADLVWERVSFDWLASFGWPRSNVVQGTSSGKMKLSKLENQIGQDGLPISIEGTVTADEIAVSGFKSRELAVDFRTEEGVLLAENFRSRDQLRGVEMSAQLTLKPPFKFAANGAVNKLPLSRIFTLPSVTEKIGQTKNISGVANGNFKLNGQLENFDWTTSGELAIREPRIDNLPMTDILANWTHVGNDWSTSKAAINAFGGAIEVKELNSKPSRIKIELSNLNASELSTLTKLPFQFKGTLSGDASLNDWELSETRWADLNLKGASVVAGHAEFGELVGNAELRKDKLAYSLSGRLLGGKFSSNGESDILNGETENLEFPISVQLTNGTLNEFYKQSNAFVGLRPMSGSVSANANVTLYPSRFPTGSGSIKVNDLSWRNERLTREVSTTVNLADGILQLNNLRADLKRGEISGRASIPLATNGSGSYQLDVRQFDLQRLLEIVMRDPIHGAGLLDARISGQLGRRINGRGTLAINRAKLLGLAGRTFRLPVQFQYEPQQQSARIEFRQSRFQIFDGNVSGSATLDLGRSFNLNADLDVANIDTEKMILALANLNQSGQGDLSGHLIVKGNTIRSLRDLKGSFTGKLNRADAFKLPILDTVAKFLGGNQFQTSDFESNDIDMRLSAGRIEIRRFNLTNSLARIAVSGNAFLDGRLDLDVVGRVERLNQPTLLEQLLGSPLSQFRGSPVAVFAQAADFLSERLVFVKISGTAKRPQVRPEAGKQLQEEAIRYFLRGSQILPNSDR